MKTDVLTAIKQERDRIEAEINKLNEELRALNVVINRNDTLKTPMRRTKPTFKANNGSDYTKSEKRIIDGLNALNGTGTAKEIYDYLATVYPDENQSRLKSSVRQFTSGMSRDGKIGVEKNSGNIPSVYYILS